MSVRAEKPRKLMLLPIWPPSAAPMVTPGTLRRASEKEVAAWESSTAFGTTTAAWGISRNAVGTLAPTLDFSGWKSVEVSAWPESRTAGLGVVYGGGVGFGALRVCSVLARLSSSGGGVRG